MKKDENPILKIFGLERALNGIFQGLLLDQQFMGCMQCDCAMSHLRN